MEESGAMTRAETEICLTCAFWNANAVQRDAARSAMRTPNSLPQPRECRSHPPTVLPTAQTAWPRTMPSDWCGDWDGDEEAADGDRRPGSSRRS